jgi:uncharacterized membrane protein
VEDALSHRASNISRSAPFLVGFGAGLFWALASLLRLRASYGLGFDLGFYQQQIWLLSRGFTFGSMANLPVFLDHLSPVLYLFVPLADSPWLAPSLVVSQAAAFGLAAGILAKRAVHVSPSRRLGAVVYFILSPAAGFALLFDFHPLLFGLPVLAAMLSLVERRGSQILILFLLGASVAVREDVAVLAGLLVLIGEWRRPGRRSIRWAAFLVIIGGIGYAAFGSMRLAALGSPLQVRYAWVREFVASPAISALDGVLTIHALATLLVVFFPLVLAPRLLRLPTTILSMATSAFFLAGEFIPADSIYYQYQAVPVLLMAWSVGTPAGVGVTRLRDDSRRVVAISIALAVAFGPMALIRPPIEVNDRWLPRVIADQDRVGLHGLRGSISIEASVSASNTVSTFFAQRRLIYDFPDPLTCDGRFTESRGATSYPDFVVVTELETTAADIALIQSLGYESWKSVGDAAIYRAGPDSPPRVQC